MLVVIIPLPSFPAIFVLLNLQTVGTYQFSSRTFTEHLTQHLTASLHFPRGHKFCDSHVYPLGEGRRQNVWYHTRMVYLSL